MRITLHDGDVIEMPFEGAAAGGYRAKSMEFGADDLTTMRRLLVANPEHLLVILRQLESRMRRIDQIFPGDGEPFDLAQPRNALEVLDRIPIVAAEESFSFVRIGDAIFEAQPYERKGPKR